MFSPVFADLGKPQWIAALQALANTGGMTINELAETLGVSYMAAKQYGEDLSRLGYLERTRKPRTAIGRPEIFYRFADRADALFPDSGMALSLELLENSRLLFGENAPERLMHQHFEALRTSWAEALAPCTSPQVRATWLATLRGHYGAWCWFEPAGESHARLIERHHPLNPVFRQYPRAAAMDTRLIEDLLGTRVERVEIARSTTGPARVEFRFPQIAPATFD